MPLHSKHGTIPAWSGRQRSATVPYFYRYTIFISESLNKIIMTILLHPTFIMITAVILMQVLQVMRNLWFDVPLLTDGTSTETETENLNLLQSHPRCGLTSGGREECWWGCDRKTVGGLLYFTVIFIIELQLSVILIHRLLSMKN